MGTVPRGQSTGRPENGHKMMEPRKNEVTDGFWAGRQLELVGAGEVSGQCR